MMPAQVAGPGGGGDRHMTAGRSRRFLAPGAPLFWVLLVVVVSLPMWAAPISFVFVDDGLFTLQVAWHIVRDGRATFNGVMPTNGYQPLWMPFNLLAMWLARAGRPHALIIMMAIEVALLGAAVFSYRALTIRLGIARSWLGVLLLASLAVSRLYGMETFLAILLIVVLAGRYLRAARTDLPRDWCGFGVVAGLLTLARLDDLLLPLALIAMAPGAGKGRRSLRVVGAGLPMVLLAGPYLLYNRINYGYFGPISEAIRNRFPHLVVTPDSLGPAGIGLALAALGGVAASIVFRGWAAAAGLVRVISLAALAQVAVVFLFSAGGNSRSVHYYTIGIVALALALDLAAAGSFKALRRRKRATSRRLAIAALAIAASLMLLRSWTRALGYSAGFTERGFGVARGNAEDCAIKVAAWMNRNLPAGSRMLVMDYPGILAYRSDLAIIPLDGLMNDYRYNDDLLKYGIAGFIKANRVTYYAGVDYDAPGLVRATAAGPCVRIGVTAPLFQHPAGSFLIDPSNLVLDVPKFCASPPEHTPFDAIWRLNGTEKCQ